MESVNVDQLSAFKLYFVCLFACVFVCMCVEEAQVCQCYHGLLASKFQLMHILCLSCSSRHA